MPLEGSCPAWGRALGGRAQRGAPLACAERAAAGDYRTPAPLRGREERRGPPGGCGGRPGLQCRPRPGGDGRAGGGGAPECLRPPPAPAATPQPPAPSPGLREAGSSRGTPEGGAAAARGSPRLPTRVRGRGRPGTPRHGVGGRGKAVVCSLPAGISSSVGFPAPCPQFQLVFLPNYFLKTR